MKKNTYPSQSKYQLHFFAFGIFIFFAFTFSTSFAQTENVQTEVIRAIQFNTTRPLRELFAENPVPDNFQIQKAEQPDKRKRIAQEFPLAKEGDPIYGNNESTIQRIAGEIEGSQNKVSWAGQNGGNPSDPSGAIGQNLFIQMVNSNTFRVYNITNGTMMLTGILSNLWTPSIGKTKT
ncbi:MAG: hypothetical protein IPI46_00810 [Bacteroidetes bacterium]|nr:hypothetical protein [Bacteroidota bacterium]